MSQTRKINLSIIVPMYNVEEYIGACLDSLENAFKNNVEIIVIDDGSTDSSLDIAHGYASRSKNIRVYSYDNSGLSAARNRGLSLAQGSYIMFVDSDDFVCASFGELETLLFERTHDIIIYPISFIYPDGSEELRYPMNDRVIEGQKLIDFLMSDSYIGAAWAALYSREVFFDIMFPINKIFEDNYVLPLIANRVRSGATTSRGKYFYRQREGSIMHRKRTLDEYKDILEAHVLNLDFIKERSSDRNFYVRLYRSHFALDTAIKDYGSEEFQDYMEYFSRQFSEMRIRWKRPISLKYLSSFFLIKLFTLRIYLKIKHKIAKYS